MSGHRNETLFRLGPAAYLAAEASLPVGPNEHNAPPLVQMALIGKDHSRLRRTVPFKPEDFPMRHFPTIPTIDTEHDHTRDLVFRRR